MMIEKQGNKVRSILTHLNGLDECDINEIIEKVSAKVGHSREIWQKIIKDVLEKKNITAEDIKNHLKDNLPESFTYDERKKIKNHPDKALGFFVDMVGQRLE